MEIGCYVPKQGFAWGDKKGSDGEPDFVLRAIGPADKYGVPETSEARLVSGLHLDFVGTPLKLEPVLIFANRYGSLDGLNRPGGVDHYGYFSDWCKEILALQTAMKLDAGDLKPRWLPSEATQPKGCWIVGQKADVSELGKVVEFWHGHVPKRAPKKRDKLQAGRYLLAQIIQERLRSAMSVEVRPLMRPGRGQGQGGFALDLCPGSLRAFIWYSFVLGLNPGSEGKTCKFCQRPFLTGPGGRRADAVYCSDRCKLADFRQSKPQQGRPNR